MYKYSFGPLIVARVVWFRLSANSFWMPVNMKREQSGKAIHTRVLILRYCVMYMYYKNWVKTMKWILDALFPLYLAAAGLDFAREGCKNPAWTNLCSSTDAERTFGPGGRDCCQLPHCITSVLTFQQKSLPHNSSSTSLRNNNEKQTTWHSHSGYRTT